MIGRLAMRALDAILRRRARRGFFNDALERKAPR